jgi:hypothetical protein
MAKSGQIVAGIVFLRHVKKKSGVGTPAANGLVGHPESKLKLPDTNA